MLLLNVVCFGAEYKTMHGHVLDARDSGRIGESGQFRLDTWHDKPQPGMLSRPALITYVPAHGGWIGERSALGVGRGWASFEEFGSIGGRAVILDACSTASDDWLYGDGRLLPECQSLEGKPLLGGAGAKQAPQFGHGAKILGALLDRLAEVEDPSMSPLKLLSLLQDVRDLAASRSTRNGTIRKAYAVRMVGATPEAPIATEV